MGYHLLQIKLPRTVSVDVLSVGRLVRLSIRQSVDRLLCWSLEQLVG